MTTLNAFDLHRVLTSLFNEEELRTLCFNLRVDYENLPAQGKGGKARELVKLAERIGQGSALEAAIRRERPHLDTIYSPERVLELQSAIMENSSATVKGAFVEFTNQVGAYFSKYRLMHQQMEEWKEVHNLLQDMQNYFAPCRGYIYAFRQLRYSSIRQQDEGQLLYEIAVEWRPCRRILRRLEDIAIDLVVIGDPYDIETGAGPNWFLEPKQASLHLDKALNDANISALSESVSYFGDRIDQHLYRVDRELLKVAKEIMQLSQPYSYFLS